jgi:ATP-binding cassette subfamily C protein LapB
LAQTLTRLNQARTSYRSIDRLMRHDREQAGDRQWLSRPKREGAISLRDVSFSYPDQQTEALKDVSFDIAPGERVAILGRIGSGKSTVARLMLGLYAPSRGNVLIDGTDIRQIDPADLRRNVGVALQDAWLFTGSIRENIAVGADRPRDEDILRAATTSGVEDFVRNHPLGYDRLLAERGEDLSGGQKQAIALARALVGQPSVLLLDEPTSSMDIQSEQRLIARLKLAAPGRTLVIITHRTSLLELVDRVIVIEEGRVALDGPKSALARRTANGGKGAQDDNRP